MRILFDTNVVLDVLLDRQPHAAPAVRLFVLVDQNLVEGLLGATTLTTVYYLATKAAGSKEARRHLETLLSLFDVAAVGRDVLAGALQLGFPDFEDAVLHEAGRHAGAEGIVTRNSKDFARSRLRIYEPAELLAIVQALPRA